ncbi:O-linked N-acetylglucosamine transferase, SPINDLY family protein [Crenalkalicoccus roseus]|uniref:O-linked N-acetylglucosamine transferase, SPINDLY family protein n=1 Tax=Crenalkalicoccus roseus TaxID=1485588 RepID=UPI001080DBC2|nr:tetratricopeptide repeat protein [Crenalkalicoccus roseus]
MAAPEGPFRAAILALAEGRPAAAVPLLEEAAARGDGGGYAWLNLGLALSQLGRLAEAVPPLERAAEALPDLAEPLFRLGQIAGLRGENERAVACFRAALERHRDHVPSLAALAATEETAGRLLEAAALIAHARALDPAEPELGAWAARIALARGDAATALEEAEAVLAQRPEHVGAAQTFARALLRLHSAEMALDRVAAHAAADPFAAGWPVAAATVHALSGNLAAALAELQAAAALAPEAAEVQGELGKALAAAGRTEEAEAALRLAVAARPNDVGLRNRLATVLWKAHRLAEALAMLDAAIADFGPEPALLMNRALLLNLRGEQAAALEAADRAIEASRGSREALVNRLSVLAYHPEGHAQALLGIGRRIAASLGPAPAPLHDARPADPDRPLLVGLLTGNLCRHPVGWLTVSGIEALPEDGFRIAAYSLRPREDAITARFRARAAMWREVGAADDAAIARLIAADGVDVLLDLGGYGEGGRPFVLHRRPAPVQIKWVGSQASSTGLDCVDWMLTDRWETPEGFERFYSERLLRLPDGYVCYAPPAYAPPVAPLPALATGRVTFGCFNNLAKITPAVMAAWARILVALPESRLVLRTSALSDAETRRLLLRRLIGAGLPEGRVTLGEGLPHHAFLASYGEVDIALDPFPYTGGLTVCEALWMGVPTVSLAGDSFAARHALSHLSNVGLADWVVETVDAYVALALSRARDLGGLAALRAGLRERVRASPLCDAPRFGRNLAAALRFAWRDWCARAGAEGKRAR